MSEDPQTSGDVCLSGQSSSAISVPRRGFLARVGVSGLAVAEALFGGVGSAKASTGCPCCNLVYDPPTIGYSTCSSATCHYIWTCAGSGTTTCGCCERKYCATGQINASGCQCWVH
jgi:hypothetical protein